MDSDLELDDGVTKKIALAFFDVLQTVVLAAAVSMVIYLFVLQPHKVKGKSMLPNFQDAEFLLTEKLSYRFGEPKRGEVVIIKAPKTESCAERNCEYIKRIIAMDGDKFMVSGGKTFLNGKEIDESYTKDNFTNAGAYTQEGVEVMVPKGQYLVIGDNRLGSRDGREFGAVPKSEIVGKVIVRYWPPQSAGLIKPIKTD